ncbi:MAG: T9SS type A sorting domain-containing protein, partial [Bacteroidaceae bacterium]|nr:T9SS type A sorting domain-containing protein [Bacteroidaceae bacterium]
EPYKVKKFTISDTLPEDYPSEVVPDITEAGMMYQGDDFVSFVGCRAYMDVYVYAINGMLVKTARTDAYGNLYLSLQELEKGIYIIKSEEITSKIMKR